MIPKGGELHIKSVENTNQNDVHSYLHTGKSDPVLTGDAWLALTLRFGDCSRSDALAKHTERSLMRHRQELIVRKQ